MTDPKPLGTYGHAIDYGRKARVICDGCLKWELVSWSEVGPWTRQHALVCPKRKDRL